MIKRYKKRKKLSSICIILIFIVGLCSLSLGYAKFSTQLDVIGNVSGVESVTSSPGKDLIISQHSPETGDGTLKTDNGEDYYFQGDANIDNYIRFNNESWRIIGIDSNGIKIRKSESIGKMTWHEESKMNIWADCTLNEYLNGTYFSTLSDTSDVVLNPVWNVGMADEEYNTTYEPYQGTADSPKPVGLVTVEEVKNAGAQSGWVVTSVDGNHWTMTGSTKGTGTVCRFNQGGNMTNSNSASNCEVQPVIYLKDTINLTGNGSLETPYEIL